MNLEAFGNGWKFSASQNRKSSWQLYDNRHNSDIAVIGFARLNGSSEADAISEKCRFHGKLDNREVGVETQNVFPFGGESIINRTFTLRDKLLEVCVDFKPGRGEIIRNIELETITFDREFVKCQIIPAVPAPGEKAELQTLDLAQDVSHRLRDARLCATKVQICIKNNELTTRDAQCPLIVPTQSWYEIAMAGYELFLKVYRWEKPMYILTPNCAL